MLLLLLLKLFFNVGWHGRIGYSRKGFKYRLKNYFSAQTGYGHSDLLADAFFTPFKDIAVRKCLEAGPFSVSEGAGFRPVIYMSTAPAAPSDGVRRFVRIKALIDLTDFCASDIQLQVIRKVCSKGILAVYNYLRLLCKLIIWSISRDGGDFNRCPAGVIN